ncbi:PDE4D, partial [Symbiodinium microadriaticum]
YLKNIHRWDFDPFELRELVPSPLCTVTTHCLQQYDLIERLEFNADKLTNFLQAIHDGYNALPYHNALHAADVTQSTFYLLSTGKVIEAISANQIAVASVLIAAAIHDVGHPGLNGKFLITTNSPIAIEYSDKSPLEMMHLATAFRLWREDANNFTDRIPLSHYREMRRLIVEMVLLTDNDMHFTLLNRLDRSITVFSSHDAELSSSPSQHGHMPVGSPTDQNDGISGRSPSTHLTTDDRQLLLLQVTLHTADVSNTAKPWNLYSKWLERITEEFYLQGDMERSLNMPISYAFDRFNPVTQSKFQLVSFTHCA